MDAWRQQRRAVTLIPPAGRSTSSHEIDPHHPAIMTSELLNVDGTLHRQQCRQTADQAPVVGWAVLMVTSTGGLSGLVEREYSFGAVSLRVLCRKYAEDTTKVSIALQCSVEDIWVGGFGKGTSDCGPIACRSAYMICCGLSWLPESSVRCLLVRGRQPRLFECIGVVGLPGVLTCLPDGTPFIPACLVNHPGLVLELWRRWRRGRRASGGAQWLRG